MVERSSNISKMKKCVPNITQQYPLLRANFSLISPRFESQCQILIQKSVLCVERLSQLTKAEHNVVPMLVPKSYTNSTRRKFLPNVLNKIFWRKNEKNCCRKHSFLFQIRFERIFPIFQQAVSASMHEGSDRP